MITNRIDVIRNDTPMEIGIEDAVPGDIVTLASGDMLPGDVRFIETKDLFIDQSQLTGESNPVEKFADRRGEGDLTELSNIGFMGTNIVSGSARAVILSTGNRTYFGSMAQSLNTYQDKSSFEKNLDSISRLLIGFMIVLVPMLIGPWIGSAISAGSASMVGFGVVGDGFTPSSLIFLGGALVSLLTFLVLWRIAKAKR